MKKNNLGGIDAIPERDGVLDSRNVVEMRGVGDAYCDKRLSAYMPKSVIEWLLSKPSQI